MALLNLFRKPSPAPQSSSAPKGIVSYNDMRVEVTALDGRLLFVAKLMNPRGASAELYQYSESQIPEGAESVPVHIRGYHDHEKKAVYLKGVISPKPHHIWQVEELSVDKFENDRAFFRLDTDIEATVTKFSGIGSGARTCRLLNISVGGARISAEQRYWEGDKLLLTLQLFEDRNPSVMYCQVLRVIEKEGAPYEYGCQFLELSEADENKITRNIFAVQRKMRRSFK